MGFLRSRVAPEGKPGSHERDHHGWAGERKEAVQIDWGVVKILAGWLDPAPRRGQGLVGTGTRPPKMEARDQDLHSRLFV